MGTEAQVKSALLSAKKKKQRLRAMALAALVFSISKPTITCHGRKMPNLVR